jgi:hypothetical protein
MMNLPHGMARHAGLFLAVLLLGVMSIRGRAQES